MLIYLIDASGHYLVSDTGEFLVYDDGASIAPITWPDADFSIEPHRLDMTMTFNATQKLADVILAAKGMGITVSLADPFFNAVAQIAPKGLASTFSTLSPFLALCAIKPSDIEISASDVSTYHQAQMTIADKGMNIAASLSAPKIDFTIAVNHKINAAFTLHYPVKE